ncbi:hypothetical protein DL770_008448 [Monosporascus sp. CRB-9-2]|nr:hypothetical protein DL770_008448 [Monosporascus sp. CRB-9-2]
MDPTLLIGDVREKEATEPKAPSFPQIKSSSSGFPEHKKRTKISAFKQKRQGLEPQQPKPHPPSNPSRENNGPRPSAPEMADENVQEKERRRIDRENSERLASMSPGEIEAARQELFGSLDPSTLERLLKRANLDEGKGPSPFDLPEQTSQADSTTTEEKQDAPETIIEDTSRPSNTTSSRNLKATVEDEDEQEVPESIEKSSSKRVHFAAPESPEPTSPSQQKQNQQIPNPRPTDPNPNLDDAAPPVPPTEHILHPTDPGITRPHWPQPPQPSDIDPHDPNFLEELHKKYFPSLPADPSKLAWMAPIPTPNSAADLDSPYHPSQSSIPASQLRFDFRGALLPPRISRAVPTTKGLHHHGEAPEAAGYTIPELSRLARSAVPGQRCVAYQTLGRVLYRLGRGEFGAPGADSVADGVWALCGEGAVLRSLYDEASLEEGRGHRSARAFAIEAVWLFEKGGWGERVRRGK